MGAGSSADLMARVGIDYGPFTVGIRNMQNGVSGFNVYLRRFSGLIGAAIGTATLAFTYSAREAAKFEYALVRLGNVTNSNTKEMDSFAAAAKDMGSKFGYGATEVVKGMTYLGQAGFTTKEIMQTMPTVLKLATVAQMELEEAANNTAVALRSFNMDVSKAGAVASAYAVVADATQTSIEGITTAMRYFSPVASAAGWNVYEATAAIGLMSQKGYDASIAGTALRGALTRILNPSREAAEIMKDMGLRFKNTNGSVKDATALVAEFGRTQMSAGLAATLFGDRASAAVIGLANATVSVGDKILKGADAMDYLRKKAEENDDYINKSFAKYAETTSKKWDMMFADISNVGIELGTKVLPYIKDFLTTDMSPWLQQLKDWISGSGNVEKAVKNLYATFKLWAEEVADFFRKTGPKALDDFVVMFGDLYHISVRVRDAFREAGAAYLEWTGRDTGGSAFGAMADDISNVFRNLRGMALMFELVGNASQGVGWDLYNGIATAINDHVQPALVEFGEWIKSKFSLVWEAVSNGFKAMFDNPVIDKLTYLFDKASYYLGKNVNKALGVEGNSPPPPTDKRGEINPVGPNIDPTDFTGWEGVDVQKNLIEEVQRVAGEKNAKALEEVGKHLIKSVFDGCKKTVYDEGPNLAKKVVAAVASPEPDTISSAVKTTVALVKDSLAKATEASTTVLKGMANANLDAFMDKSRVGVAGFIMGNEWSKNFITAMQAQGGALKAEADEYFGILASGNEQGMKNIISSATLTKDQLADLMDEVAKNATTVTEAFDAMMVAATMRFQSETLMWAQTFMGFFATFEQGMNDVVNAALFGGASIGDIFMKMGQQMLQSVIATFIKIQIQHLMSSLVARKIKQAETQAVTSMAVAEAGARGAAFGSQFGPAGAASMGAACQSIAAGFSIVSGAIGAFSGGGGLVGLGGMDLGTAGAGAGELAGGVPTGATGMTGAGGLDMGGAPVSFASGGYAAKPTLAIVGDTPEGEWMIPGKKMRDIVSGGSGGPQVVNNYYLNAQVQVLGSVDDDTAMKIASGLDRVVRTRDTRLTASTARLALATEPTGV